MKKNLIVFGALIVWLTVIGQYFLMIDNRVVSLFETTIRFFSFFTILTNTLVAVYFSSLLLNQTSEIRKFFEKPGVLTATTVYISVVGLVYQVLLRHVWEPTGWQMLVDELLHTIIPLYTVLFWYLYEDKSNVSWKVLPKWLIYPLIYLVYIMIRGHFSSFYPYPFVNVTELGYSTVLINSFFLLIFFVVLSTIFLALGKWIAVVKSPISTKS
jgi:hypothetical protein